MVKETNNATGPGGSFKVTDFVKDYSLVYFITKSTDNLLMSCRKQYLSLYGIGNKIE